MFRQPSLSNTRAPLIAEPADRPLIARDAQRRLRVGFLAQENLPVPSPVPGGSVARIVHELARNLASRLDVTVCSLEHPDVPEGEWEGVTYLRVPRGLDRRAHATYEQVQRVLRRADLPHRELQGTPFYAHGYASAGLRRLAERDPDIVHLQNVGQFLPLARRLLPRARLVLHMHCDWLRQLPPATVRRRLVHADLVLGVSDYITNRIRDGFPDLAERCQTLHNGVDLTQFALPSERDLEPVARLRAELRIGPGPVLLYVGALAPEKGIHVLLPAFEALRRRLPEATLIVVGRHNRYFQVASVAGREERRARRLRQRGYPNELAALARPLDGRVAFVGGVPHSELHTWYALADAFVMPSTGEEPFPLPVLEAFATGVPVVATRMGGLPEVVLAGVNGMVVPAGDVQALADAFEQLLRDPSRAEVGRAGRALIEQQFSWAHQADRLASFYEAIALPTAAAPPAHASV